MSGKRVLALYGALLFCFAAVVCRLYWLCSDTAYGARAAAQSVVALHLPARRGNFYDHRGQLLTGQTTRWMALCVPGEGSYARLFAYTDAAGQTALYQKRNAASPFLLEVDRDVSALGVSCWPAARRSSAASLAVQLLGYLVNFLGTGVTAGAGSAGLDLERTEANQLDLVAFLQSGGNGVQGSGDSSLSVLLGNFSGSGHGGDQFSFVHEYILL